MFWLSNKTGRIEPVLNSLRHVRTTNRREADLQQDLYLNKTNWKSISSFISLIIFFILIFATVIGLPIIITKNKEELRCDPTLPWIPLRPSNSIRLCIANASWNPKGITVAGLSNGLASASLAGLQSPYDIHIYENGTILVVDSTNNRIVKWYPNATVGILIAGTGSYGSWNNLLAKPMAITVRNDYLFVSDMDNYRIQVFPLDTHTNSPTGTTILGQYGRGSDINQLNQVTCMIAPVRFPSLLYLADSANHRILVWDAKKNLLKTVAGMSGLYGSDSIHLSNPTGITLDERTNSLYIADRLNNRIQKYDMNLQYPSKTVAGWGELNTPYSVQLDPSGIHMFIADTLNHRILVWLNGTRQGRTIAGNGNPGNSVEELNSPTQIRFDENYNLYVVDTNNNRIQRFDLISNGC